MWLLWKLVQPPENNGLGMDPNVAMTLDAEMAMFFLSSEEEVRRMDYDRIVRDAPRMDVDEYMRRLRSKYEPEPQ